MPRILRAGLRGVEEGPEALPTPDLLRWLPGASEGLPVVELDRGAWLRLLDGSQVDGPDCRGKGVLLAWEGLVLGTAEAKQGRLIQRLPEARARWLRQAIAQRVPGCKVPAGGGAR